MGKETYDASKILYEALNIGEQMLICGAEVYRVEDTISRICWAYGMTQVDVFTITSSIVVTVVTAEGEILTQTRRIDGYETHLDRLSELNALSRSICAHQIEPKQVEGKISKIMDSPCYTGGMTYLIYCLVSGMFTLFFGGSPMDSVASVVTGAFLCMVVKLFRGKIANRLLAVLCASVLTGFAAVAVVRLGLGDNVSLIVIGNIMLLIPGIAMTNSIRDMLGGDTMSGILRLCESLLIAIAIAGGMAMVLYWYSPEVTMVAKQGFMAWYYSTQGQVLVQLFSSFFGSLGFAMLFHIHGKRMWQAALGGMLTWGVYLITESFIPSVFWGYTIAAAFGTCYGEWMARREKTPATLYLVPAVVMMIPGGSLYNTMYCVMQGDAAGFATTGLNTIKMAAAISIGILLASTLIRKGTQSLSGSK